MRTGLNWFCDATGGNFTNSSSVPKHFSQSHIVHESFNCLLSTLAPWLDPDNKMSAGTRSLPLSFFLLHVIQNSFCFLFDVFIFYIWSHISPLFALYWYLSALWSYFGTMKEPRSLKSMTLWGGEYGHLLCWYHSLPLLTILPLLSSL